MAIELGHRDRAGLVAVGADPPLDRGGAAEPQQPLDVAGVADEAAELGKAHQHRVQRRSECGAAHRIGGGRGQQVHRQRIGGRAGGRRVADLGLRRGLGWLRRRGVGRCRGGRRGAGGWRGGRDRARPCGTGRRRRRLAGDRDLRRHAEQFGLDRRLWWRQFEAQFAARLIDHQCVQQQRDQQHDRDAQPPARRGAGGRAGECCDAHRVQNAGRVNGSCRSTRLRAAAPTGAPVAARRWRRGVRSGCGGG